MLHHHRIIIYVVATLKIDSVINHDLSLDRANKTAITDKKNFRADL